MSQADCKVALKKGSKVEVKPKKAWGDWGGFEGEFGGPLVAPLLVTLLPAIPFLIYASCAHFECSVTEPLLGVFSGKYRPAQLWKALPETQAVHWYAFLGFIFTEAFLMVLLPGKRVKGLPTPTGAVLEYKVNALLALFVSLAAYLGGSLYLKLFSAAWIFDEYGPLIVVGTVLGFIGSFLAYFKGRFFPTNKDRSLHGSFFYDLWMGLELNPRIGFFDIKIFAIGRIGMIGWAVVVASFTAKQYELFGELSNSMILLVIFQFIYIADWAWKEEWYVATLDIMHDHFGFFLSYGSTCWVTCTYTAQAWFLAHHPIHMSPFAMGSTIFVQVLGYVLFRITNNQKLSFRAANGKVNIWGKPAVFVAAKYSTTDGKVRENLLLASGFWGLARHFNYLTDLMITASFCMCCGFDYLLPWTYQVWMTCLLLNRAYRDDRRCRAKYGEAWDKYCKLVPNIIIPYLW